MPKRASSWKARAISISLAPRVRGRGSSRRAVCMVRVEAPETTWPWSHELPHGPQQGQGIHAPMALEALVLIGQQHAPVARVHLPHRHRQAPAAILGREGPQQPAILVLDQDREIAAGARGPAETAGRAGPRLPRAAAGRRPMRRASGRCASSAEPCHGLRCLTPLPSPYSLCR